MTYRLVVGDADAIEDRLNNRGVFGPFSSRGIPVGGLTLDFTTPATPVTFTGAGGSLLSMRDVVAQINAVITGMASIRKASGPHYSGQPDGGLPDALVYLVLERGAGFAISGAGSADALLVGGAFTSAGAVTSTNIVGFTTGATMGAYALILDV